MNRDLPGALLCLCGVLAAAEGEAPRQFVANETAAAASCKAFAEGEEIYRRTDYDRDGILEYAQTLHGGRKAVVKPVEPATLPKPTDEERQKIEALIKAMSEEEFATRQRAADDLAKFGPKALEQAQNAARTSSDAEVVQRCKKLTQEIQEKLAPPPAGDLMYGLYGSDGTGNLALIDKTFAEAECPAGTDPAKVTPKAGYLFRVLTRQGKGATGGERNYIVNRNMTLGYALLAFPKEYGGTGKKCFTISNNGTIFERDFGDKEKTEAFVKDCIEFNPTKEWTATE